MPPSDRQTARTASQQMLCVGIWDLFAIYFGAETEDLPHHPS